MYCSLWVLCFFEMGYVFNLSIKYLIAAVLCRDGWQESLCMMRSVVVGSLQMLKVSVLCVLLMVMSK
jgi:hypothetical protein